MITNEVSRTAPRLPSLLALRGWRCPRAAPCQPAPICSVLSHPCARCLWALRGFVPVSLLLQGVPGAVGPPCAHPVEQPARNASPREPRDGPGFSSLQEEKAFSGTGRGSAGSVSSWTPSPRVG